TPPPVIASVTSLLSTPSMAIRQVIFASSLLAVTVACGSDEGQTAGPPGETVEVALPPFQAPPAIAELGVRVVRADGAAAEGARVRYVDTGAVDPDELMRVTVGVPDAGRMLDALATVAVADESGRVAFPWTGGPVLVDAALEDTYRMAAFGQPEGGRMLLHLARDTGLVAIVRRSDGSPANEIPVRMTIQREGGPAVTLAQRMPDPQTGEVRFRDRFGGIDPAAARGATFAVSCAVVGGRPSPMAFDPAAPAGDALALAAPAASQVLVECIDQRGRPVPMTGFATIEPASGSGVRLRAALERGRCAFTAVAPESLVRVSIEGPGGERVGEAVEPSALERGGEVVVRVRAQSRARRGSGSGDGASRGAPR
ncbi:MAG: hypothetical protein VXZ39_07425, partial [Planctomycetota bacterium]|nr:hypothetical protein [Planctomycetota bacterium]